MTISFSQLKTNKKTKRRVDYKEHYALVNKKTNLIASSNTFEISAASAAILNGDDSGIMAALPLDKAQMLLEKNKLVEKKSRHVAQGSVREITRYQAKSMLPALGALFNQQLPPHRPPRINEFCRWIVAKLQARSSEAFILTESRGFHDLLDANRNARWWQDQLKKMQS
jgi:hypothetical protein